ncbi:MAG: VOC family protein [Chloroflexota bacterium]
MTIERFEHIGIVVEDLPAAIAFFEAMGLTLQGQASVEGAWADRVVGIDGLQADIAMLETPGGEARVELSRFRRPASVADVDPAANVRGIRHLAFTVTDVHAMVERLRVHGAELVGAIEDYQDIYRLCYVRGPEGILVELAQRLR